MAPPQVTQIEGLVFSCSLIGASLELSALVKVFEELVVIDKRVEISYKLTHICLVFALDVVKVYIVHIEHLCGVTGLVESVVVKCLLRFNDAGQVN